MRAGLFAQNGDTIKICRDGTLADGQHRLMAISTTRTPQWLLFVFDIRDDVNLTIDRNARRTNADDLYIAGEVNDKTLAAALALVWRWKNGDIGWNRRDAPSGPENMALLRQHPGLREAASKSNVGAFMLRSVAAFAFHHATLAGVQDVAEFFKSVAHGEGLYRGNPAWTLRDQLIRNNQAYKKWSAHYVLAITLKALRAYATGQEVRVLKMTPNEKFPVLCEYRPEVE